jgi:signal transduction histidine kinase
VPARFLHYSEVLVRILREEDYALYLEALAEALPLEVAATDAAGRVIVWNRALAHVAGPRERAVGRPLLEALPWLLEDPNLDWPDLLEEVLRGGAGRTFPRHPLGPRVVRATLSPMRGQGGRMLGSVLALEDITHGARAAEERRMRDRAHAVHDLGESLAHEIRNPLNALSLNLQLLRECLDDPDIGRDDIRERTERMLAESRRLERLVVHLLEVSRGEPLDRRPTRIDPLVEGVLIRLEGFAASHGCRIAFRPASSRELLLDRVRIDRAVENVVRNAVEAAAEGGRQVWVATRDTGISTVVEVEDDGPGIKPQDLSNVFVLYSTGKRGGTGLGLPLAREDVRRHGGEIEAKPRHGGGAAFLVYLPAPGNEGVRAAEAPA